MRRGGRATPPLPAAPEALSRRPWGGAERLKSLRRSGKPVEGRRPLRFRYRGWKGEEETREVEPQRLVFKGSAWYLLAWCRARSAFRLFRADRIREPEPLPGSFSLREVPESVLRMDGLRESPGTLHRLKFHPSARERLLTVWNEEDISEQPDGSLVIEAKLPEEPWVAPFLVSFGDALTVLEPKETKRKILEWLDGIRKNYRA